MCGIAGALSYAGERPPEEIEMLAIRDHMHKRGPDGAGLWRSKDSEALLAHRRLSILDPSDRAAQPMSSADGRFVVVFNGEIYNYPSLRAELESAGARFETTCDTEILLQLFAREGLAMLPRLRGMFAFALYETESRRLHLARDAYGIKPLYYSDDGHAFRFASQVKALLAGGHINAALDAAGLAGFCLLGSVPEPFTFHAAIRALPAGHSMTVDGEGARKPLAFASVAEILSKAADGELDILPKARRALRESVEAHLLADVEVGLFLSAGVDSSSLLGLMRDCGQARIRAFTLGFAEFAGSAADETGLASKIAAHYGAEHIVRQVTKEEFEQDLPQILDAMDQPTIDGVNVWFIAKAAREAGLKVALTGVGGDELLAGYPSFFEIPRWARATWALHRLRVGPLLRKAGESLFPAAARRNPKLFGVFEYGGSFPGAWFLRRGLFQPHELSALLGEETAKEGLRRLGVFDVIRDAMTPDPIHPRRRVCALESGLYLRNQLLRDADWAGMAHSVEIRTPYVDPVLLRAMAPAISKLGPGHGKALLASVPANPPPRETLSRPKSGFASPMRAWLGAVENERLASRAWALRILAANGVATRQGYAA